MREVMHYFALSFCDPTKPQGEQYLGCCIVEADDEGSAVQRSWALGINPGGEVLVIALDGVPPEHVKDVGRFIAREEVLDGDYVTAEGLGLYDDGTPHICTDCNHP